MLTELSIRNFAIIDELNVTFTSGLNILTGETGAGKSILIGAVSLLLGDRASSDMIRSQEDTAMVEAMFNIGEKSDLKEKLKEMGFLVGNELILKRIVSRTGKNRVYIDGQLATIGMLSAITENLVNICGQHEHQVILNAENHSDIVDEFGGLQLLRAEYAEMFDRYLFLKEKHSKLLTMNKTRDERVEFLKFHLKEIDDAAVRVGEDEVLLDEKRILNSVQKLTEYARLAYESLYGKTGSVQEEIRGILANIREIKKIDKGLSLSEQDLDAVYYQLEDAAMTLREYIKNLSYDPARLEAIDDRVDLLGKLKRKYGRTLDDVLKKRNEIEDELVAISSVDEEIETISKEMETQKKEMLKKATLLSQQRRGSAAVLTKAIEDEIHALRMEKAEFKVEFGKPSSGQDTPVFNARGIDEIEFYLTTNVGETAKPLNRIASGGELSRIMLAVKKVLAKAGSVGTLIFDEVDSGIGGAVAEDVGKKLRDVSQHHQIICITHLPQIACFGDTHYRVAKNISDERTVTSVDALSEEERLDEIARMLGGAELTKKTRAHAREMLEMSRGREGVKSAEKGANQ
ncbi:MAG: DNA repair protein RecN [Syntrophaceae bacterium]|nr:DNA repair protein RecN [Syntrophaceae bacterium]